MGECDRGVYLASDVESCLGRTRGAEKAHKYCQWVVVMVVVVVGGVQRKEGVRSHLLSAPLHSDKRIPALAFSRQRKPASKKAL